MSPWHWALVIAVGILLFGAKRLPEAARSLGRSARVLKAELGGDDGSTRTTSTTDGPGGTLPGVNGRG